MIKDFVKKHDKDDKKEEGGILVEYNGMEGHETKDSNCVSKPRFYSP